MEKSVIKGFSFIVGKTPKILILGSMPSIKSLSKREYYAHPTNRFWRILEDVYKVKFISYNDKLSFLKNKHIALWDVVETCEREGSLDSKIKDVNVNDIKGFLKEYATIQTIYCNGKKAYQLLMKYFPELEELVISLPSTSSANQSKSYEEILQEWSEICNDK